VPSADLTLKAPRFEEPLHRFHNMLADTVTLASPVDVVHQFRAGHRTDSVKVGQQRVKCKAVTGRPEANYHTEAHRRQH
jgi:hypothetical protein